MEDLLLVAILLPLGGAVVSFLMRPLGRHAPRSLALLVSVMTLGLAALLTADFVGGRLDGEQFAATSFTWLGDVSGLDIQLTFALDGLSIWLFALSAVLMFTSVLVSWEAIDRDESLFYGMLLLLEAGCLGVFAARDIILFYIFFEFTLIPLFFLIGVWGSEQRRYAAVKFFLFTLTGSLITFLGLLAVVFWSSGRIGAAGRLDAARPPLSFNITEITERLAGQYDGLIDRLDQNADGAVSVLEASAGKSPQLSEAAFKTLALHDLDADGDCCLSLAELQAASGDSADSDTDNPYPEALLVTHDDDEDGRLNEAELHAVPREEFHLAARRNYTAGDLAAMDFRLQLALFLALFLGFAVKVPLFPLHTWLPLAHVQAPAAGSIFLAGILLKIGAYGFLRFSIPMLPDATVACMPWLLWLSVAGILYGALTALAQSDMKRLIAYSSVSHLGYCTLGLFSLNVLGTQGGMLQLINHGVSTGALFALVGMLYERYHTRRISDFGGLARRMPVAAFFMVLFSMSSIGLPGLNGFAGEFLILLGMFQRGWADAPADLAPQYQVISVLAVAGVVLGAWYMLWLVQRVFFGALKTPHVEGGTPTDINAREVFALAPLAVLTLWIGLFPGFFLAPMSSDLAAAARPAQAPLAARIAAAETGGPPSVDAAASSEISQPQLADAD